MFKKKNKASQEGRLAPGIKSMEEVIRGRGYLPQILCLDAERSYCSVRVRILGDGERKIEKKVRARREGER